MPSDKEKEELFNWLVDVRGNSKDTANRIVNSDAFGAYWSMYKKNKGGSSGSSGVNATQLLITVALIVSFGFMIFFILPFNSWKDSLTPTLQTIPVIGIAPGLVFYLLGGLLAIFLGATISTLKWWSIPIVIIAFIFVVALPPLIANVSEGTQLGTGSLSTALTSASSTWNCLMSGFTQCQTQSSAGPKAPPSERTGPVDIVTVKLGSPTIDYQVPSLYAKSDYILPVTVTNPTTIDSQIRPNNFYINNAFIQDGSNRIICGASKDITGSNSGRVSINTLDPQDQKTIFMSFLGKSIKGDSNIVTGEKVDCTTAIQKGDPSASLNPLSTTKFRFALGQPITNYNNPCQDPSVTDKNTCLKNECNKECGTTINNIYKNYNLPQIINFDNGRYLGSTNECECTVNRAYNIMDELCNFNNDQATIKVSSGYDFTGTGKGELILFKSAVDKVTKPKLTSGPGPLKVTVYFAPDRTSLLDKTALKSTFLFVDLLNEGQGKAIITDVKVDNPAITCTGGPTPSAPYYTSTDTLKESTITCNVNTDLLQSKVTGDFLTIPVTATVTYKYSQDYTQTVPIQLVHQANDKLGQFSNVPYYCKTDSTVYGYSQNSQSSPTGTAPSPNTGTCPTVSTGPCSVSSLQSTCFGFNANKASQICGKESGGDPSRQSLSDLCKDGTSFSAGLFQINIIAHASQIGGDCVNLFNVNGQGTQGSCLQYNTNGVCIKWDCTVNDQTQYQRCVQQVTDVSKNIQLACSFSNNGANWGAWSYSATSCGLPH